MLCTAQYWIEMSELSYEITLEGLVSLLFSLQRWPPPCMSGKPHVKYLTEQTLWRKIFWNPKWLPMTWAQRARNTIVPLFRVWKCLNQLKSHWIQHCSSLITVVLRKGLTEGAWADAQRAPRGTQSCTGRPSPGNCGHLWSNSEKQPPREWSGDILEQTCSWGVSAELRWCQGFVPTERLIRCMHMHAQFRILLLWLLPNNKKQMKRLLEISTSRFFNTHKEQFLLLKLG